MKALLFVAVINDNIEASGHGDNQLMQIFMSMPAPCRTTWHIVEVIDTLNVKGDMIVAFDECQISLCIRDFRQFHDLAVMNAHFDHDPG